MSAKPISFEEARFRRALEDIRGGSIEAQFRAALKTIAPETYVVFGQAYQEKAKPEIRLVYDSSDPKYRG